MEVTIANYIEKFIVSKCKLWKAVGYLDFVLMILHNGQIGLPQWFFIPCEIHRHLLNSLLFALPVTSINPFYTCCDLLWSLYNKDKSNGIRWEDVNSSVSWVFLVTIQFPASENLLFKFRSLSNIRSVLKWGPHLITHPSPLWSIHGSLPLSVQPLILATYVNHKCVFRSDFILWSFPLS